MQGAISYTTRGDGLCYSAGQCDHKTVVRGPDCSHFLHRVGGKAHQLGEMQGVRMGMIQSPRWEREGPGKHSVSLDSRKH
jgi:hypothetical protein